MRAPRAMFVLVALLALAAAAAAARAAPGSGRGTGQGSDREDDVEEVEVKPAAATSSSSALPAASGQRLSLPQLLGRFHPALVHMPIAWLMLVLIVDLGALIIRRWERAGLYLLAATVLGAVPALLSGWLRLGQLTAEDAATRALAAAHRNTMLMVAALCVVALVLRLLRRNELHGLLRGIYLLLVGSATALVAYGAHLGGKMVYGPGYLPF